MRRREGVQLLPEQDIRLGVVRVQERHLRRVGGVFADRADELVHGGDARSAGDHADVGRVPAGVLHGALGPAHVDRLADLHPGEVLGHGAVGVGLDEELDAACVAVVGDGRVGAGHRLAGGGGGAQGDVLARGQAEDVVGLREGEDEEEHVGRDLGLLREREGPPLAGVEDLCALEGHRRAGEPVEARGLRAAPGRVVRELFLHVQLGRGPHAEGDGEAELQGAGDAGAGPELARGGPVRGRAEGPGERGEGLREAGDGVALLVGGEGGGAGCAGQAEFEHGGEEARGGGGLDVDDGRLRDLLVVGTVDFDGLGVFLSSYQRLLLEYQVCGGYLCWQVPHVERLKLLARFIRVADLLKGLGGIRAGHLEEHGASTGMVIQILGHIVDWQISMSTPSPTPDGKPTLIVKHNPDIVRFAVLLDLFQSERRHTDGVWCWISLDLCIPSNDRAASYL